ncbi:MAG TPA: ATP-binding protein, partial [Gillisia sp.]|nr:ATP-binding protein [Gillisia sp.]
KFQEQLSRILNELNSATTVEEVTSRAAALVKSIFGYDRVMVYQFDDEWNGKVVAEEKEQNMESWLGLHYPATDIPKPSRDLFLKQEIRIISDVGYDPSTIIPQLSPLTQKPLDLSLSELRGVSPIHIQYLKNMKVGASLTAAIVLNGKLWGLLACHHSTSKFVNYYQRQSVKFLTQIYTNTLSVITSRNFIAESEQSRILKEKFFKGLESTPNLTMGLLQVNTPFTSLVSCTGGVLFKDGELYLQGLTPLKEEVLQLIQEFLIKEVKGIFHTGNLEKIYAPAAAYKDKASGILAISLGENGEDLMIWFRRESSKEVNWGGNPKKNAEEKDGIQYLHPRKSFEKWTQRVSGISTPWKEQELNLAASLREGIIHIIVKEQKERIKDLNTVLTQVNEDLNTFGYSVSHDLRAPLRGISGYAKILKENYLDRLDERGRKFLGNIINSAEEMNGLIEDLLSYAKISQVDIYITPVNINLLVQNILDSLNLEEDYSNTKIIVEKDLPDCTGDRRLIFQLFSNLINNALKYSAEKQKPEIHIGFLKENNSVVYFVKDNGIGFDPLLEEKIYKVFSRLVGDEYPGTGVGLATAKKVVEKHKGKIWVKTTPGKGSCFYFTLGDI